MENNSNPYLKKAAIYARVSTVDQNPENQLVILREFVQKKGYEIYKEYVDYESGSKINRVEYQEMKLDAHQKKFDVVIVWKVDRLGRSTQELLNVMQSLYDQNIDLISYSQPFDTTTPTGKLMFGLLGLFAEFERDMIRDRIMAGLRRAKERGVHCGRPYKKVDLGQFIYLRQFYSVQETCKIMGVNRVTIRSHFIRAGIQYPKSEQKFVYRSNPELNETHKDLLKAYKFTKDENDKLIPSE